MVNYIILRIPKEPRFSDVQLQTIVDICVGVGLIGFGTVAAPVIFDKGPYWMLLSGLLISCAAWYTAIRIAGLIK